MANGPFERTVINVRERPLSSDINQAESQLDYAQRFMLDAMYRRRTSIASDVGVPLAGLGCLGDSLKARPTGPVSMNVTVNGGLGLVDAPADVPSVINAILGLDDRARLKPVVLLAPVTFAVTVPSAGNSRVDIIEVNYARAVENPLSRDILDPGTGVFNPGLVNKTLSFGLDGKTGIVTSPALSTQPLSYKRGVAAVTGTSVAPAVTPGYTKIAEILVQDTAVSLDTDAIKDVRTMLFPYGSGAINARISMPGFGAGSLVPTLQGLDAPPGVSVIAVGVSGVGAYVRVYVLMGNLPTNAMFRADVEDTVGVDRLNVARVGAPFLNTRPFLGALNAAERAEIQGANASPAGLKAAWLTTATAQAAADRICLDLIAATVASLVTGATTVTDNPLSAVAVTINVVSNIGFTATGTIRINDELITYTGLGANTFTGCIRGSFGTTGAAHVLGSAVVSSNAGVLTSSLPNPTVYNVHIGFRR